LVDKQHPAAMVTEFASEVCYAVPLKIEVVHVDIQTLAVVDVKLFFGILQQKSCLTNAARTLDANHAVTPIDFVHEGATNRCINMLYQVPMRPEESFHYMICLNKHVQRYKEISKLQSRVSKNLQKGFIFIEYK
jgi:hypothetical protein